MKDITNSIVRNMSVTMGSQVVTWICSFVLILFLPRYLGAQDYGRLHFAISLVALMGLIIDFGQNAFFVKEVARDRSKASSYFVNGLILRVIIWAIAFSLLMTFILQSGYPPATIDVVVILGFGELLMNISKFSHRVFMSFERMKYRSISVIVDRLFLSAGGVTMLLLGYGVKTVAIVMVIAMFLNMMTSFKNMSKVVKLKFEVMPSLWPVMIKGGIPFLFLTCFSFIYYRIDVVMLSELTNDEVVGWYGAPYRLFDSLMFFALITQLVIFPVFARLWTESRDIMAETVRKILDVTLIVGTLIAVLLFTMAKPIVALLFGLEGYSQSIFVLQVLSLTLPLIYANFVMGTLAGSTERQKPFSIAAGVATVVNIGLNFILIPHFHQTMGNGGIGAAIATLITEIFVLSMMFFFVIPSRIVNFDNFTVAGKLIALGILVAGIVWWVESQIDLYYISGIMGVVLYTGGLFIAKIITRNAIDFVLDLCKSGQKASVSEPSKAA